MALDKSDFLITILGSGTCVPSLARSSCSVLLEIGVAKILLDSGSGTIRRLLEAGTDIFSLSLILYSHFHPDHSGEMVPLLFATKYPNDNQRHIPLTMGGGKGFKHFFSGLKQVFGRWIDLPSDKLNLIEFNNTAPDSRIFDHFTVDSIPVEHNPESVAFRISDARGRSLVYSGDTDFSENLMVLSENADILICESAHLDEYKTPGHLTPSMAGKIADRAHVKKLILTHFYPECTPDKVEQECRKTYKGPLVVAEDLMTIRL
jgi:ribonuclease BN (tRNA processing enzyme)